MGIIEIFIFLLGLAVGSFLNVAIHRLPRDESVVKPGSRCPKCEKAIRWYDNLPVLSYVLLGGRCRHCREGISFRYPLVELVSGLLWYVSWRSSGGTAAFLVPVVFNSLLLVMALADLETGLIPDEASLGGIAAGLLVSFFWPELHGTSTGLLGLAWSVVGLLAGGGLIYLTGVAGNWIFQRELAKLGLDQSMGGGDVKLLAMAGSFLGWEKVLLAFFIAPIASLPFALYQRIAKKEQIIPYGPFLALACAVQFYFGETIWAWFVRV